jgi:hypothetical protein
MIVAACRSEQASDLGSRSSVNKAEARLVVQLVLAMLQCQRGLTCGGAGGVDEGDGSRVRELMQDVEAREGSAGPAVAAHQLGVICFFRGQAALIKQMLASGRGALEGVFGGGLCARWVPSASKASTRLLPGWLLWASLG